MLLPQRLSSLYGFTKSATTCALDIETCCLLTSLTYLHELAQGAAGRGVERPPYGGDDPPLLVERRDDDGDGRAEELGAGARRRGLELGNVLGHVHVVERRFQNEAVDPRPGGAGYLGWN